jgi:hypothetical protein
MPKPPKDFGGLTKKQRKFVQEYIKTEGNATEAAMRAYDFSTRDAASVEGSRLKRKPVVALAIATELMTRSMPNRAVEQVDEALGATVKIRDEDGNLLEEDPNYTVRLKAADTVFKLMDAYPRSIQEKGNVRVEVDRLVKELDGADPMYIDFIRVNGRRPSDKELDAWKKEHIIEAESVTDSG